MLTSSEAVSNARQCWTSGRTDLYRMCLNFVREKSWQIPSKYYTAEEAWDAPGEKHAWDGNEDSIPLGAPVFTHNASNPGAGHVFTIGRKSASGRRICYSTDVKRHGGVDPVPLSFFPDVWGHQILGWRGDLNGVDLHLGAQTTWKVPAQFNDVSLVKVQQAHDQDQKRAQGDTTPGAINSVKAIELSLRSLGFLSADYSSDGYWGSSTSPAYAHWQRYLGLSAGDANGRPGQFSLARLGKRFGFRVMT